MPDHAAISMVGILFAGFLVFFMQAGFALVETGLTRAKNVVHTMCMNVMAYSVGALGFWICGFALMFGNYGSLADLGSAATLNHEVSLHLFGREFGLIGYDGFFLAGQALGPGLMALFLFQVMFMDTAATIPTGALAERWRFASFLALMFLVSTIIYPVYGNWVWGNGWLAQLGQHFGLGHGHVDFAGSSVVHMTGGLIGLVGAWSLGPRIGKYRPDGRPNPLPAHNVPMYLTGALFLAFGWFGFNTGGCLAAADLNSARIAVNTILASAAGALSALGYVQFVFKRPDPSFICNGLLAGLVSITAPCAFVAPWAAVLIGAVAGVLAVWSWVFVERVLKVDDPVGAISVHGFAGLWGILAVGLFANGTYGHGWNHTPDIARGVTGLFYGDPSQLLAQCIGIAANILWVVPVTYVLFRILNKLIGNRVSPQVEMQGLDIPELGALGYIMQDAKVSEGQAYILTAVEPRPASVPPALSKRFILAVEGLDQELLACTWSDLCRVSDQPIPPEFRAIYPYMTTLKGNRFTFRAGSAEMMRTNLEVLLRGRLPGMSVRVCVED